jgi:hypothetical protein
VSHLTPPITRCPKAGIPSRFTYLPATSSLNKQRRRNAKEIAQRLCVLLADPALSVLMTEGSARVRSRAYFFSSTVALALTLIFQPLPAIFGVRHHLLDVASGASRKMFAVCDYES